MTDIISQYRIEPKNACRVALVRPITDDPDMRDALDAAVTTYF